MRWFARGAGYEGLSFHGIITMLSNPTEGSEG